MPISPKPWPTSIAPPRAPSKPAASSYSRTGLPACLHLACSYRTGSTFIVAVLHSPALDVHATGEITLSKQMLPSCNAPAVQDVRKAAFGKLGLAAAKSCSMAAGLSVCVCAGALNSAGIVTESRALRTAAKGSPDLHP